jgi:hypothetical protein
MPMSSKSTLVSAWSLVLADVGDVIEDQQVILVELAQHAFEHELTSRHLKSLHEIAGANSTRQQQIGKVLPDGQTGFGETTCGAAPAALRHLLLGEHGEESRGCREVYRTARSASITAASSASRARSTTVATSLFVNRHSASSVLKCPRVNWARE